jgi:hypothetical protein
MTGTPLWPFDQESFRLKDDPLRNAIISAALELAEADRIIRQRAEAQKHGEAK